MKRIIILCLFLANVLTAQIYEPVSWQFSHERVSSTEVDLFFNAEIDDGWNMYSQDLPNGVTATPTEFTFFSSNNNFELLQSTKPIEINVQEVFDKLEDVKLKKFKNRASFKQRIKLLHNKAFKLEGDVYFQVCDSTKCLQPEAVKFSFNILKSTVKSEEISSSKILEKSNDLNNNKINSSNISGKKENNTSTIKKVKNYKSKNKENNDSNEYSSLWLLFIAAFGSGLLAILTPCVLPMIPMTVAFFTKQSESRSKGIYNALIFGVSIVFIFVLLGTTVSFVFGEGFLNKLATGFWLNFFFFVIMLIFAISFLGAFDIKMPSSWINKSVQAEGKGGMVGIFFMAFTLALVSFSCTGPIVGPLLVTAATGSFLSPIIGMLGFSLALALPFALFAAFPGWLNSMPKSGGWLNTIKVVLGFLELMAALKFLSMADVAIGGHYIERELFLAIWIGLCIALAFYLFGFIRLPHDSPIEHLSVGRTMFATFVLAFSIYLIPGLWGAPLKLISGFDPPAEYSESPGGSFMSNSSILISKDKEFVSVGGEYEKSGIPVFKNKLKQGLKYAEENNKPVLLDFTGINCYNCRRMESNVWAESGVKEILSEQLVVVKLYVDQHDIQLNKKDQKSVTNHKGDKEILETIGQKWGHLQKDRYKTNSQPYYRIVIPLENGEFEDVPVGSADYENHNNKDIFKAWLEKGLKEYKKIMNSRN